MSRLIKVRLADASFWFFGDKIKLTSDNLESSYIDFDALDDTARSILLDSVKYLEIKLFDSEGRRIKDISELKTYDVLPEEIDEYDDDDVPEINCITVSEQEEEKEELILSEEDMENAKILLGNKLNTVKRTIESLVNSDKNVMLMQVMLGIEEDTKNRKQIISCLETKLKEFMQ
jgi:hypothetical protein